MNVSEDSASQSDDGSEYESGSGSDFESEEDHGVIMKPTFIPRKNRVTIQEQERKAQEQAELEKKKSEMLEINKSKTRVMVAESIRKMEELQELNADDVDSDTGKPDDTDDLEDDMEVGILPTQSVCASPYIVYFTMTKLAFTISFCT
jgi:hypothetical protein